MKWDERRYIGSSARQFILGEKRVGSVTSTFRNGFCVLFGRGGNEAVVTFHTPEVPRHPWGVGLPSLSNLRSGESCHTKGLLILFLFHRAIELSAADVPDLRVHPWRRKEATQACERMAALNQLVQRARCRRHQHPLDPPVCRGFLGMSLEGTELVQKTLGRGSGSTPSGDDYLVGRLAALHALSDVSPTAACELDRLRLYLGDLPLCDLTPLGSAQMVWSAVCGSFPETVGRLLCALSSTSNGWVEEAGQRVTEQGATSGEASLLGIHDGLNAVLSSRSLEQRT